MSDDLLDAFKRREDLHSDLIPYLSEVEGLGTVVRHPLVYSVPHGDAFNAVVNRMYVRKCELLDTALKEEDLWKVVRLHEKPWRLHAFVEHEDMVRDDAGFWKMVRDIWIGCENVWQNYDQWCALWLSGRPMRKTIMTAEERAELAGLPETISIWRGGHHRETLREGLSWSLDRDAADWFANRYSAQERAPHVCTASVRRDHVLALFHTNEAEVVVDPKTLTDVSVRRVPIRHRHLHP